MTLALAARAERWRVPIQTGAAAGLSWWIATSGAGHAAPLSAPVVAVIAIGATTSGRARRTIDVIVGLTIGIAFATLLVSAFGRSAPLLALIVAAAMLTAGATRGGDVLMTQAGIAAILVFATPHDGSASAALARIADALIGGASATMVSLFILPPNPVRLLTARFHALHTELAEILDQIADGLRKQDADHVAATLERARATDEQVNALHATRPVAAEIARFVPARRGARALVTHLDSRSVPLDHAIRHARVLARATLSVLSADRAVRNECAASIETLAEAVRQLDPSQPAGQRGHDLASQAADRLAALHSEHPSPARGAIAAASRGIADDLA